MIIINNKEIRNTVEQVHKNKDDIEDLQENEVTKTYVDNSISTVYGDVYTKEQADNRFPTETHVELLLNDYVAKSIDGEDVEYGINYGTGNNTPQLYGSDSEGSHPCDAKVQVTYDQVHINANDYNHGDDDDTYTGSIDVTDGYVDVAATDGTNTTTLRVAPSGVTVNGSPIGGGGSSIDDVVLDYSTTFPENLPEYLELTQAQYNLIKQHVESHDFNIRLVIITQAGPNVPEYTILYPNNFVTMGTGQMNSDSGFFGKRGPNTRNSSGGNLEFLGTYSIYYDSSTHKYLVGLYKFKVAYTA